MNDASADARAGPGKGPAADVMALSLGVLGTAVWQWPLLRSGFDRVPGNHGDARYYLYILEHWFQAWRGRADVLSPGMFHPVEHTLAYADTMAVHAIPYSLLRFLDIGLYPSLGLTLVLFSFLNFVAGYYLLRRVLMLNVVAATAGALFFAFNSPRYNQSGHFPFQASFFVALTIAFVVRFVRDSATLSTRKAFGLLVMAAICWSLQFAVSIYEGWFFLFWSGLFVAVAIAIPSSRSALAALVRRFPLPLIGSALVLVLGLLPLLLVHLPVSEAVGPRSYSQVQHLTPQVWSLAQMGHRNLVWGSVSRALTDIHPLPSTEHNVGIGLVPSLAWLALTAWAIRSMIRGTRNGFLAAAILATTLFYAIGMTYGSGWSPWRLVYLFVPGADGLRAVARYVFVLSLPISVVLAFAVQHVASGIRARFPAGSRANRTRLALLYAIVAFGVLEQFGRTPSISGGEDLARVQALAAALPADCNVFYAVAAPERRPVKIEYQIDAMLVSILRGVPTLNGYSGHTPPGWSLREVEAPDYDAKIQDWIRKHNVPGRICRLEIS